MKDLSLLIWITQLGFSVAVPPVGFVLLGKWLQGKLGLGAWVLWVAGILGLICAIDGLIFNLKAISRLAKDKKQEDKPPVSFNEHD